MKALLDCETAVARNHFKTGSPDADRDGLVGELQAGPSAVEAGTLPGPCKRMSPICVRFARLTPLHVYKSLSPWREERSETSFHAATELPSMLCKQSLHSLTK